MSCPEFIYSALGRRGIGVVQPQSGLDYPFVSPTPDIRYLVADLHLSFDDPGEYSLPATPAVYPLRIKHLYNVGCWENSAAPDFPQHRQNATADIQIVDANGQIIFDTFSGGNVTETVREWGADYKIYSWNKNGQICNLVAYTTWTPEDRDDAEGNADDAGDANRKYYDKYLTPVNAVLDVRATYKLPKRLLTLRVKSSPAISEPWGPYTGPVVFQNGRNTTITAANPTINRFRYNHRVTFAAEAGSGLGRYSNCPDNTVEAIQPIKKINGVAPNSGDFLISATSCLYARRPTITIPNTNNIVPDPNVHQQIGGDCGPCCKCSDFAATALYMNQVQSQYALIGTRAKDVKLYHEQNVAKWAAQQQCSINPLRLLLVPQRCPYMDVVLMICNPCQDCIPASTLTVDMQSGDGVNAIGSVVCGYTALYSAGINGRPIHIDEEVLSTNTTRLNAQFPIVRAGGVSYVQFRVKFSVKNQYPISATLTGKTTATSTPLLTGCATDAPETRTVAMAEKTEALFCTTSGETDFPC